MANSSFTERGERRGFLIASAGSAVSLGVLPSQLQAQGVGAGASTFVLVHPAWPGGWCWKKVTPLLRAHGHHVLTPTLTGLG